MTTATLSLHSQRSSNPGATEESTGQVYAGVDVDAPLNSALRFAPPADIAGATITSVTLTIRAKYSETTGGVLCKFALADNTSNLAAQNLASTAETNHDHLHTPTYTLLATPPAGSVEITSTYASYSIDLTATADVANLEDDVIVLCQYDAFQRFTGSDDTAHITFDGIGETTPASLEIVYTPAPAGVVLGIPSETDAALAITCINPRTYVLGIAAETDAALAITAPASVTIAIPSETDASIAIAVKKTVSIGIPSETDTALALTIRRNTRVSLGIASENDGSLSLTIQKDQTLTLGIAAEAESALAIIATVSQTIALGIASETDAALGLTFTFGQIVALAIAPETDAALAIVVKKDKFVTLGIASETDGALAMTFSITTGGYIRQFFHYLAG